MKNLITLIFLSIFSTLILTACQTVPVIQDAEKPVEGQGIVFGHFNIAIDEKIQKPGYGKHGYVSCCLMILPPDSNQAITYKLDEDGIFYWNLAPGAYHLLGFRFQQGTESRVGLISGTFTVPDNTDAVYIGNISVNMIGGRYVTIIQDKSSELISAYKKKFPGRTDSITASLLQLPDKLGSFSSIVGECIEKWQVDCSGKFSGITPLEPKVGTNQFIKTESLQPMFSWEPSGNDEITYDFVLYEAATFSLGGLAGSDTMKGRVVVYEENISEPLYKLKSPLKEDTKYFWSVRFRDKDEVSTWSTYSHFGFYIIVVTSGYGQWFGFSTP